MSKIIAVLQIDLMSSLGLSNYTMIGNFSCSHAESNDLEQRERLLECDHIFWSKISAFNF